MADTAAKAVDPRWAWAPYRPAADAPWDVRRVGHLYRRAAFGATAAELEAGLKAGPEKTLEALLAGGPGQAEFDAATAPMAKTIARSNDATQLRAWWLYRMLYGPHPLREKLTLFWHNHFATSNAKVQSARLMLGQYELLRRHALGNFAALLREVSKDPAMMAWLDTRASKKGSPNENYARELMELFSLGIGPYTEQDVREAARAFTGWDVRGAEAVFNAGDHDGGEKTVLGQTGRWKGDDVVRICLEQPVAAPFVVGKLFRFLVSETLPATPELLAPLADRFRASRYDFGGLVRAVLGSNLFFSPLVYRTRVKPPVDFALGVVRGLEGRVGTVALAAALEGLGQNVFYPPSVKGWDGGPAWLNGQTLLFRQNLALALTSTEDPRFGSRTDPAALARRLDQPSDEALVDFFLRLFLQGDVHAATRERLLDYRRQSANQPVPAYWTEADAADHRVRALCHLVLTLPEIHLS
jgi:uncharacterized protein (DUF1800 family)